MDERKLGDVPVADIEGALLWRAGEREQIELERPPYPYQCPNRCGHDVDEHDEDHRCHAPGCNCGKNKW